MKFQFSRGSSKGGGKTEALQSSLKSIKKPNPNLKPDAMQMKLSTREEGRIATVDPAKILEREIASLGIIPMQAIQAVNGRNNPLDRLSSTELDKEFSLIKLAERYLNSNKKLTEKKSRLIPPENQEYLDSPAKMNERSQLSNLPEDHVIVGGRITGVTLQSRNANQSGFSKNSTAQKDTHEMVKTAIGTQEAFNQIGSREDSQ